MYIFDKINFTYKHPTAYLVFWTCVSSKVAQKLFAISSSNERKIDATVRQMGVFTHAEGRELWQPRDTHHW